MATTFYAGHSIFIRLFTLKVILKFIALVILDIYHFPHLAVQMTIAELLPNLLLDLLTRLIHQVIKITSPEALFGSRQRKKVTEMVT